ncbi:MAG: pyridoxal phosphate-dependent aminotransferase [Halobacteriovoraceae bacterium]|nr:pyridoxal phosphate-dependent aminotransferase [Halobacteriovoraceae bacterium]
MSTKNENNLKGLSKRVLSISPSKSVGLAGIVAELRRNGEQIIGLNVGEPDILPHKSVSEAIKKAIDDGQVRYGEIKGLLQLREKIIQYENDNLSTDFDIENVFVAYGSKQILYLLFQCLIEERDEVIIPAPYWVTFPESVKLAGGTPVIVPTKDHQLDIDLIKKAITPRTKAIIINTPNNPTGAVYGKESLKQLLDLVKKNGLYLISDEAYEHLRYDGVSPYSLYGLDPRAKDNLIIVKTFSKNFCMTGVRVGYVFANPEIIKNLSSLQSHATGNVCDFTQMGAIAALNLPKSYSSELVAIMKKRRDLAFEYFSEFFDCILPEGAYYLFPNIDKYKEQFKNDIQMSEYILKEAKVALLPGSAFGAEDHLRISFSVSESQLELAYKALKRIF